MSAFDLSRDDAAEVLGFPDEGDTPGVIAVRAARTIVSGVISDVAEKSKFTPGDWVVSLDSVTMWRVEDGQAEWVEIDRGPPVDYRNDPSRRWDGPNVTIGVGGGRRREWWKGEIVLHEPDAVYSPSGVHYYVGMPAGPVSDVVTGGLASPKTLLKDDERPPRTEEVDE
jgi:hypothetical protein